MITLLRGQTSDAFVIEVVRAVLRGLGVSSARIEKIVTQTLPEPLSDQGTPGTSEIKRLSQP